VGAGYALGLSPDGREAALAADDGTLVWDIRPERWRQRAWEIVGRNLSAADWARYLPNSGSHRKTCEQWPLPPPA
jgi:hypothetical protein